MADVRDAFGFPAVVNEKAARVVAAGVALITATALLTGWLWLSAVLAVGFALRVAAGPRYSPLGQLATKVVAPRLGRARLVPGPPKRFAQTVGLCERFGLEHTVIGHHRGGRLAAKAVGLVDRSLALARWARRRPRFDLALGHGSNDVTVAAKLLRVPSATAFDYEWATVQHNVNCRLVKAVVVPDAIPPETT